MKTQLKWSLTKIPPESVKVNGTWSVFKLTWREATEINYGEVYYQMNLIVEEFQTIQQDTCKLKFQNSYCNFDQQHTDT